MTALTTVAGKGFNGKFTGNIYFPIDRVFYVTIADVDIGNLKSLNALFNKFLDHMLVTFEQNRMIRTIHNFKLFDKKKMVNHF